MVDLGVHHEGDCFEGPFPHRSKKAKVRIADYRNNRLTPRPAESNDGSSRPALH